MEVNKVLAQSKQPTEETNRMLVVPDFPEVNLEPDFPRGCYVFFVFVFVFFLICQTIENIGNEIKKKLGENSTIWECLKPIEFKIQLLANFCPPSVWHEIRWYLIPLYSWEVSVLRNLKQKVSSVRVLVLGWCIKNPYSPCRQFTASLSQREYWFQVE